MAADIAKIKRNIKRMMDQGAPDADIDGYLAEQGVTLDMLKQAPAASAAPAAPAAEGFFTQKGKGGLADYLPEWATNAAQTVNDVTDISGDTAFRGLGSKLYGADEQQRVQQARDRTPGYLEAPADIITAIATSPYRVGSALVGGAAGAGEGALNAYGHQPNWVPSMKDAGNIAYEASKGALLGSGAAKAGEWLGKGWNALRGGKAPYSTPEELADAAANAKKRSKVGKDTVARNERMKQAELAQAKGPAGFQKLLDDMDRPLTLEEKTFSPNQPRPNWPHQEKVLATKLANPQPQSPNIVQKGLQTLGSMAEGGGGWGKLWTGPLNIAAPLLKGMGAVGDVSPKHYEDLQKLILDSQGRLKTDKVTVDRMRDFLAKTVVQGTEGDRLPQPFGKRVSR